MADKLVELSKKIEKDKEKMNYLYTKFEKKFGVKKDEYDSIVSVINSERSLLRIEIRKLYSFLNNFGDMEKEITPFDFTFEKYAKLFDTDEVKEMDTRFKSNKKVLGATLLFGLSGLVVKSLYNHHQNNKLYKDKNQEYETLKIEWLKELHERAKILHFMDISIKIAAVYYHTIIMVKNAINDYIIPELEGVKVFLYVSSIKENIVNKEPITNIVPHKISKYKKTKFNNHYEFVKNSFDFYTLICGFFTQNILTSIIQDGQITLQEKKDFKSQIKQIEESRNKLITNTFFCEVENV